MKTEQMTGERFAELCKLLPEGVTWGDNITPHMLDEVLQAALQAKSVSKNTWCKVIGDDKSKCQFNNLQCAYPICSTTTLQPLTEADKVRELMLEACRLRDKHSAAGYMDASYQVSDEFIVDGILSKDQAMKEANQ
jgi:hypothetical protein